MNRYVYLYELDSTISSETGIKAGRNALLNETLERGNKVVITFNQLVDSKALVGLLQDEKTYKLMLQLFKNGSIKVVRFHNETEEIRTAAQYLLTVLASYRNTVNEKGNDRFIFGAIPIKRDNVEGIDTLYRAIMYSDISLITDDSVLRRYVNIILEISQNSNCYIDGKNPTEQMKFIDVLTKILEENKHIKIKIKSNLRDTYEKAIKLLCTIRNQNVIKNTNARSGWLEQIEKNEKAEAEIRNLAKYIVFICYNYAIEDGIKDVCKRYIIDEDLGIPGDYLTRIRQYLKNPDLITSIWDESQKTAPDKWMKIKLTTAVHVLDTTKWLRKRVEKKEKNKTKEQKETIKTYGEVLKKELFRWRLLRFAFIMLSMAMAFVYGTLFYGIDTLSGWWKGVLKSVVQSAVSVFSETAIYAIITTVTFAIVMAIYKMLKKTILKKCKISIEIPDFAESFFSLVKGILDIFIIIVFWIEMIFSERRQGN